MISPWGQHKPCKKRWAWPRRAPWRGSCTGSWPRQRRASSRARRATWSPRSAWARSSPRTPACRAWWSRRSRTRRRICACRPRTSRGRSCPSSPTGTRLRGTGSPTAPCRLCSTCLRDIIVTYTKLRLYKRLNKERERGGGKVRKLESKLVVC